MRVVCPSNFTVNFITYFVIVNAYRHSPLLEVLSINHEICNLSFLCILVPRF